MKDALGRYRINVVAELTGIPAATLRAWERRYGVPTPARTAAAYRLYTDSDVTELKRLRDLCASGMAIAEAARLVRLDRDRSPVVVPVAELDLSAACEVAVERIVDAVCDFDPEVVGREVARALYVGSAQEVFDKVLAPSLRRIGDLWHEGRISIAQEHLASGIIEDAARSLARLVQPSEPRWRVLLACVADEDHVIGLHGVAIHIAGWGIRSIDLGARTPPQAVADAAQRLAPDGVGLSMTLMHDVAHGAALIDAYAAACAGRPWFVGGAGVAPLADHIRARRGVALVGSLDDHRALVERALQRD
jgi:DNA-binding transcriptional MerR regulator/methylmalonyl-CoA mutase cobalamin-binding subunit